MNLHVPPVPAAQRKTALMFMLAFALAGTLGVMIAREAVQPRQGVAFYVAGLSLIACILLILAGSAWDRALFRSLREIRDRFRDSAHEPQSDAHGSILDGNDAILHLTRRFEHMDRSLQKAEAACRAKGNLLAVVSHEMRTPLNGMLGFARLLQDSALDSSQRELVGMIVSSGRMMERLLGDLLDLSRIEAGRIHLERDAFNLRECVETVIHVFMPSARASGIRLTWTVNPNVPEILIGDSHRIRQILINLIGNGLKFTKEGSVSVTVEMAPPTRGIQESAPAHVAFAITDTGIGIPADKLPLLFLPFSQIDASACSRSGGSGLGLAISKRLCELMGGSMSVRSVPGQGSTFTFTLLANAEPRTISPDELLPLETVIG